MRLIKVEVARKLLLFRLSQNVNDPAYSVASCCGVSSLGNNSCDSPVIGGSGMPNLFVFVCCIIFVAFGVVAIDGAASSIESCTIGEAEMGLVGVVSAKNTSSFVVIVADDVMDGSEPDVSAVMTTWESGAAVSCC